PGSVSPVEPGDCLTPGPLSVDVSDAQRNSAQRTRPALACQRRRVTVRGIRSWRRLAAAPGRHRGGVGEPVVRAERDTPPVAAASGTALVDARAFAAAGAVITHWNTRQPRPHARISARGEMPAPFCLWIATGALDGPLCDEQ